MPADKILIVEDEAIVSLDLKRKLERMGYSVPTRVNSGEEAIIQALNELPDLILMDIRLDGEIDGIEAAQQIRTLIDIPVIFLTAHADENTIERAKATEPSGYLVKPFDEQELRATIEMALVKHRSQIALQAATEKIRQSEERFRILIDSSADAIILIDVEGNILFWNQAAQGIYGYKSAEILKRSFSILIDVSNLPEYEKIWNRAQTMEDPKPLVNINKITGVKKDGTAFPIQVSLAVLPERKDIQFVATIRDLTEIEEMEERSRFQDRLASLGQLSAGIAHDFNNILGGISIYIDLLMSPKGSVKQQEYLGIMKTQITRGADLAAQLLDFSRKSVLERSQVDLVVFLMHFQRFLRKMIPENIKIEIDADGANFTINADPSRLQQVLLNLAINARDAMKNGGELSFNLSLYTSDHKNKFFKEMQEGPWVCLKVTDNGSGIPDDVLPHIFDPFFTTKKPGSGTGLGLAQAYGIIKQHDGFIDVKSVVGAGTEFRIFLPISEPKEGIKREDEDRTYKGGDGEEILVVEDNAGTRDAIVELLTSLNYLVRYAESGEEALEYLGTPGHGIALIVSDMVMPGMKGQDLATIIREEHPNIKVILTTGYPLGVGTRQLISTQSIAWIQKPFQCADIAKKIRYLLDDQAGSDRVRTSTEPL